MLLLVPCRGQSPSFPLPPAIQKELTAYRQQNDLGSWIYTQVQWVSASPAERAPLLEQAVTTAWRPPQADAEIQAWLDLLLNEGHAMLLGGNIVRSTDAYRAALQWAAQYNGVAEDAQVLEYILKPIGNNYTRLGDYEQALYIQQKALAIALSLHDNAAIAGVYANLGTTAGSMGRPELSLQYCREGLKKAGPADAVRGLLLCEQADALAMLGQAGAARQSIAGGIRILEQKSGANTTAAYWLLSAYQQAGDISLGQPQQALQLYNKALALQSKLLQQNGAIRLRERAKLFYRLGHLRQQEQQYAEAHRWLQECLSLLTRKNSFAGLTENDLYGENTLVDALFAEASICRAEQKTGEAMRLFQWCFAAENKLRNEYITGAARERSVSDSRRRYETAVEAAWTAWQQTHAPEYRTAVLQFVEAGKARLLLDELQQQQYRESPTGSDSIGRRVQFLEKALAYYERDLLEKGAGDSLQKELRAQQKKIEWELADIRKKTRQVQATSQAAVITAGAFKTVMPPLLPQQRVRSFFTGSDAVYIIETDASGILFIDKQALPAAAQDSIRQFVQHYFQQGPGPMLNSPGAYYRQAYAIYRRLFAAHPLAAGKEYILLPDGVLSLLPVEALVTSPGCPPSPAQWPFLLQQTVISYAWSLQTLQAQYTAPVTGQGFAGFFIAHDGRGQSVLEAVEQEKQGIGQTIRNGRWQLNEQATVTAFRTALEKQAIIHISTHAFAGRDSAAAPHIRLYDAPFYLFELKGRAQHPAIVVLSACRTGDGRMITGEGVQSLARAFTACGTNGVVAGWWNVHDEVAARLMRQFYAAWAQGDNAAKALHQSKLALVNDPQISYLHKLPYYWAALNYQGCPLPMPHDKGIENKKIVSWWPLPALLLLLGGVAWYRGRRRK